MWKGQGGKGIKSAGEKGFKESVKGSTLHKGRNQARKINQENKGWLKDEGLSDCKGGYIQKE